MNSKIENALRSLNQSHWVNYGNTQPTIKHALKSINLYSGNSGWYEPTPIVMNGLDGIFMLNEDGSIYFYSRVIKRDDGWFLIEELTSEGANKFEAAYYNAT